MTFPWRVWVLLVTLTCAFVTAFGMQTGMVRSWWPIAGLWAAACFASFGLSVWAAGCLLVLGVLMDFMTEAPIGAWSLALLSAYGVALVAWDRQPPIPVYMAETVAVLGGLVAAGLALMAAGGIAGHPGLSRAGFMPDFFVTALLYPAVRFVLIPASIRGARR